MGSQSNCPLFSKLCGEIRNIIYDAALVSSEPVTFFQEEHLDFEKQETNVVVHSTGTSELAPQLLLTCRQIQVEAQALLYYKNEFQFLGTDAWEAAELWLNKIGTRNVKDVTRFGASIPEDYGYGRVRPSRFGVSPDDQDDEAFQLAVTICDYIGSKASLTQFRLFLDFHNLRKFNGVDIRSTATREYRVEASMRGRLGLAPSQMIVTIPHSISWDTVLVEQSLIEEFGILFRLVGGLHYRMEENYYIKDWVEGRPWWSRVEAYTDNGVEFMPFSN